MPDKPHSDKKSEHAQRIRTERAVMRMTGLSRSQIRGSFLGHALTEYNDTIKARRADEAQQIPEIPAVQFQDQTIAAGNIPTPAPRATPTSTPSTGVTIPVDIWLNGALTTLNFFYEA